MAKKNTKITVDVEKLLEGGAHFGHQMRRWNPKMEEYMYMKKDGVFVFDLIKTQKLLEEACEKLTEYSKKGKVIVFVGTKKQIKDKVREVALAVDCPYVCERWLGGTLTNFGQMEKTLKSMKELEENLKTVSSEGYTKKEVLMMNRKLEKMKKMLGGISSLKKIPDVMIIIDVKKERSAVREAKKKGVELVGVVDSNGDPTDIDWVVPMNDDASGALEYVVELFGEAIKNGKKN